MILFNKIRTKKVFYLVVSIIIEAIIINFNYISSEACDKKIEVFNDKKVVLIDPGHGGIDGGAVSKKGTVEKDINLKISLKLKKELETKGFNVVLTRDEDKGLYSDIGKVRDKKNEDLNNRCKVKNETKCDAFISVHLNMFEQSQYYGAQVWYSKEGESGQFAHIMQQNLIKDINNNNKRREKCAKGAYKILRCHDDVPSVLVECGFLSNPTEEEKLKEDSYQLEIAKSLAKSIEEFFNIKEERESRFQY
ncbi:N-acetylmuramoyl-L-alanine amidase CwlD [Clostridium bovifaecis]|uniref:N-acetylmuramoyl-L-alanine amidase CwlD n=1 Tax=Clostridium bovifaecis TaxID=2184719 RepID=A0A6I6ES59_9CLOT|nr:N-acetylmuramoyl-L-alanine amidase CwlD [Clostridium bovifaecis]